MQRQRGTVLIYVVFVGALLISIGMAYLGLVLSETQIAANQYHNTQVLYVAKAGIAKTIWQIENDADWMPGSQSAEVGEHGGTYTTNVTLDHQTAAMNYYTIRSTGRIANAKCTVEVKITATPCLQGNADAGMPRQYNDVAVISWREVQAG